MGWIVIRHFFPQREAQCIFYRPNFHLQEDSFEANGNNLLEGPQKRGKNFSVNFNILTFFFFALAVPPPLLK